MAGVRVALADGITRPARVRVLRASAEATELELVLTEGRNRQVRRMMAACGHRVRRLVRVAIGKYALGDLALCLPYVAFAQALAMLRSMSLGLTPDSPNAAGKVHRVVQGVSIYRDDPTS